jgi:hypothetical protein
MKPQLIVTLAAAFLFSLAQGIAAQAAREPDAGGGSAGAIWGAGVWIGITILLLVGVVIIAYQATKRPNRD